MKTEWIVLLSALILFAAVFAVRSVLARSRSQSSDLSKGEVEPPPDPYLERARADVKAYGWHVVAVSAESAPSALYTVGLWETYQHPELLVFVPNADPRSMAKSLQELVKGIVAGKALKAGEPLPGAFKTFPGQSQMVHAKWTARFLDLARAYYGDKDFPAMQVFWPDKGGHFPWQSEFDSNLFRLQPVLYQENPVLTGAGYETLLNLSPPLPAGAIEAALEELFVQPDTKEGIDILEAWRWHLGPEAALFRITLFGDVFVKTPEGDYLWLETGVGEVKQIAGDLEEWRRTLADNPASCFQASTLLEARAKGYELGPGQVYDWIQEPVLGGAYSINNLQKVPVAVRLTATGQLAQQLAEAGSEEGSADEDDTTLYAVVINEEKQYSMWPLGQEIPTKWKSIGKSGTKQECLDIIETLWVDLRPKSLREKE